MRRLLVFGLTIALSLPASLVAAAGRVAQSPAASLAGTATTANGAILANVTVQLRDLATGEVAGTTTSSDKGEFSFTVLNPGDYVVEIVDASGQVIGTSGAVTLAAGATVTSL